MIKFCTVCGSKTTIGFNFGVQTCQSCKQFFRRNAFKIKELRCRGYGNCNITIDNRKSCPKCRLIKCYALGMEKQWIFNANEKQWQRVTINEMANITNESNESQINEFKTEDKLAVDVVVVVDVNENSCQTTSDDDNDEDDNNSQLSSVVRPITVTPIPKEISYGSDCLQDVERQLFDELFTAATPTEKGPLRDHPELVLDMTSQELYHFSANYFDHFMTLFTKSMTKLTAFNRLTSDDQIALIKHSCFHIQVLLSVFNFDYPTLCWRAKTKYNLIIISLKSLIGLEIDVYTNYENYFHCLYTDLDSDINIIYLLLPIIIFNYHQSNLIDKQLIKNA
ncbi:vitamin D3 receptor-like [Oppia nitens]|uniref:vitamin D3 receptor-like n=1 Tax=Oppia nitens TaxID=1686743 RepID=UPI0023DCD050|nr:vitamin D3 receptor-like [Oppia nitens]